ncbi:MAG: LptA/OstA family protein [Sphingomonas sp.]
MLLTGNVHITQAEMVLTAARMIVTYTGQITNGSPQVSRLDASGGGHRLAPGPERALAICGL